MSKSKLEARTSPRTVERSLDLGQAMSEATVGIVVVGGAVGGTAESRQQGLMDPGQEALAIEWAVEQARGSDAVVAQDGQEGHGRPPAMRCLARQRLTAPHPRTIEALCALSVKAAYLDGELCALCPDGVPAFSRLQAAMHEGRMVAYERIWPRRSA
jgi:hypothetical protein